MENSTVLVVALTHKGVLLTWWEKWGMGGGPESPAIGPVVLLTEEMKIVIEMGQVHQTTTARGGFREILSKQSHW